jgi:hypothetical protein
MRRVICLLIAALTAMPAWGADDPWLTLGSNILTPAPDDRSIKGMGGSGTDAAGGNLYLDAGGSTGAGVGGCVYQRTTSAQTTGVEPNPYNITISLCGNGIWNMTSDVQGAGLRIGNSTNVIAAIFGGAAGNEAGTYQLSNAGNVVIQLSPIGLSYFNTVVYFGNGVTNAAPAGQTLLATGGLGTDIVGADFNLGAGSGTGAGAGGNVRFLTALKGTTGNTSNGRSEQMRVRGSGGVTFGAAGASLLTATGEMGFTKITAINVAPGAAGAKEEWVCGTNAGTAKKIAYAGTSATPVTIIDNVGAGVTGC